MRITVPKVSKAGMVACGLMATYLFGKMFYVAGQGAAQPADVAIAACFLFLITPRAVVRLAGVNAFILLLMVWAIVVNLGWLAATANTEFLRSLSYYAFNLGILAAVFWTRQKNPRLFDLLMPPVTVLAVAVQIYMVTFVGGYFRSAGSFENPNQLAFWALCMLAIWVLSRPGRIGLLDLGVAAGLIWIELNSLSRAGIAAMGLLLAVWMFRTLRSTRSRLIALSAAALAAALLALTPAVSSRLAESEVVMKAEQRMNRERPISELEYRGYDRIFRYVGHIVVGAGEGEKERFLATGNKHTMEIHSTFGTLLFSYGLLGITLFFLFIWRLTRTTNFDRYVYLAPALAYGVTHNGLRFSFFWFMVGMLLSYAVTEGKRAARKPAPQRDQFGHGAPLGAGPVIGR